MADLHLTRKGALRKNAHRTFTLEQRLQFVGWDERLVVPELGPCWEWKGRKDKDGYGRLSIAGSNTRAHRVACEAWAEPIPEDKLGCHKCDNPPCIRPSHVYPGDPALNSRDAVDKDRISHGERVHLHKMTTASVVSMRERYARGEVTAEQLAVEHGVVPMTIYTALWGKTWKRAGGPISGGQGPRSGERSKSPLTEDDVRLIRSTYAAGGISLSGLSKQYGIGVPSIHAIIKRQSWKHID